MNLFACVNFLYNKHKLKSDVLKCFSTLILQFYYYDENILSCLLIYCETESDHVFKVV